MGIPRATRTCKRTRSVRVAVYNCTRYCTRAYYTLVRSCTVTNIHV